jgi:anti-sigma B factor antagonist
MRLRIRITNVSSHQTQILLAGEADLDTVSELKATLEGVAQTAVKRVVLDLSELKYLGSAGVGVIINALDQLEARKSELVITGAKGPVSVVLQMLGLSYLVREGASPHARKMSVNGKDA